MKGSMKWYSWCAVKSLLFALFWGAAMWLFSGTRSGRNISYYVMLGYAVAGVFMPISFYKKDIPLAISMGVSRKNVFWGTCFYNLLNFIIGLILVAAADIFMGNGEDMGILYFLMAVLVFWTNVFGTVQGVIGQKFGKGAAFISGVVLYFLIMAGLVFSWRASARWPAASQGAVTAGVYIGIAAVTLLVYSAVMVLHYRTVQKITV